MGAELGAPLRHDVERIGDTAMPRELVLVRRLYRELLRSPRLQFPRAGELLIAPDTHGVYLIYSPRGAVLHVGRTVRGRKGLRQRLRNHLHGSSSFVNRYLRGDGSRLRGSHAYAFVEVPDARRRALLEAYATGNLCPRHLGIGEIAH